MATRHLTSTTSGEQTDYQRFCTGIKSLCGIELAHYRQGQMERRLRSFASRQGSKDLDEYMIKLKGDARALDQFRDRMTINVSELFRNPERFEELEKGQLADLAHQANGSMTVWSAGCSYGAEAYTLGIILSEARGVKRYTLHATDIDTTMLEKARAGEFSAQDLRNIGSSRLRRWFSVEDENGERRANDELRSSIAFGELNLLSDRYPTSCDLILCRNVVIYFTDVAKDDIYRRFLQALRPGGMLFVGSTERINGAAEMGWEKPGTFFYRRPLE